MREKRVDVWEVVEEDGNEGSDRDGDGRWREAMTRANLSHGLSHVEP